MAKPGRNDPCPCGSGNKYKKCCLAKEEAVARDRFVEAQAQRDERAKTRSAETAAAHRLHLREVKAAIAAGLTGLEDAEPGFEDTFVKLVNRLDPPAQRDRGCSARAP
jgi:hypothetical protein